MRNLGAKLTLVSAILMVAALLAGQSDAKIDSKSVVGLWLFDKGSGAIAKDYSGNGHDGEIKGNVKWIEGQFSKALSFPGAAGSFVMVPHDDSLNLITFTMIAWLKAVNTQTRQEIMMKRAPGGTNSQNYHFQIESGRTTLDMGFTVGNAWPGSFFGKTTVADEQWHHVAATYDQKAMTLYVNGELDAEMARNSTPDTNTAVLAIGAVFETGTSPLKGSMDDVGLFNIALDGDAVKNIMEKGLKEAVGVAVLFPKERATTTWATIKNY
jgi:hypothetical protein